MTSKEMHPKHDVTRTVSIIEDNSILRTHFVEIIQTAKNLVLAGVASSISEARELLVDPADLFLIDIGLPDGSGLDFIGEIRARCGAKCLIVTSFGDREMVVRAIEAGADGYLLKDSEDIAILDGIELTLSGGAPISASAAVYLLERLRGTTGGSDATEETSSILTPREIELLQLFAKGFRYKEAAKILGISDNTVGSHVKSTYRKLAVNSRSEAIYEAVKSGQLKL